jgi:hypothetical protein
MLVKGNIPVTWATEWEDFIWKETFMTNEVPKDDIWNTPATHKKLELETLYAQLNISAECTKHYMSIRPELSTGLRIILDNYKTRDYNYNFLKLTAGHNLIKHYDSYSTFIKFNEIPEERHKLIKRTIVMMTEWQFGQVFQVEDKIESHWKIGDTYTWEGDAWHGLSNFGFNDCVIMQVTWI